MNALTLKLQNILYQYISHFLLFFKGKKTLIRLRSTKKAKTRLPSFKTPLFLAESFHSHPRRCIASLFGFGHRRVPTPMGTSSLLQRSCFNACCRKQSRNTRSFTLNKSPKHHRKIEQGQIQLEWKGVTIFSPHQGNEHRLPSLPKGGRGGKSKQISPSHEHPSIETECTFSLSSRVIQ